MKHFIVHFHDEERNGFSWNVRATSADGIYQIKAILSQRGSKVIQNVEVWEGKIEKWPSFTFEAWKRIMKDEYNCGPLGD